MKRRFSYFLIWLVVGIVIRHITGYQIELIGVAVCLILLGLYSLLIERDDAMILGLLFLVVGNFAYGNMIAQETLLSGVKESTEMVGSIVKQLRSQRGYVEYEMNLQYINTHETQISIREKTVLRLNAPIGEGAYYQPGDWIKISGVAVRNSLSQENLQGYDFYLKSQGYGSVIETSGNQVTMVEAPKWNIRRSSDKIKRSIEYFFDDLLEQNNSRLIKSILFGNQGYLTNEELDLFSKAGTAHIIAVSGLHVGLLALVIQETLKNIGVGRNQGLMATAGMILFYAYLVDFPISIIRALLMYYFYLLAYFLRRRYDSINILCMVAVALLIYNPLQLFSVSFQLSFVATLSILLFSKPLSQRLIWMPTKLKQLVAITLAAQIGTVPIIAYHFQQISLISLFTNIAIVPILAPLFILALFSFVLSFISMTLSQLIGYTVNGLLNYIFWIIEKGNDITFSSLSVGTIDIYVILCYYLILTAFRLTLKRKEA